jgi:hypothetical protein
LTGEHPLAFLVPVSHQGELSQAPTPRGVKRHSLEHLPLSLDWIVLPQGCLSSNVREPA